MDKSMQANKPMQTEPAQSLMPMTPANMVALLEDLVDRVADAIESKMQNELAIHQAGGPYESSLILVYRKRLHEAAVAAVETVVTYEAFRPSS